MAQLVLYMGEKYIKEETDTEVILTEVGKNNSKDMTMILSFTKDKELSDKSKYEASKKIYRSIMNNLYKELE